MDKLAQATEQASSYYDFAGLDKLRSSSPNDKGALEAAAKQFESIFTKMLLTSMRKASEVLESDSPFNSQSSKFYRDMHDQQMVSDMAATGGLGLADMIMEQLAGTNPNFKPASVLRPDDGLDMGAGDVKQKQDSMAFITPGEKPLNFNADGRQSFDLGNMPSRRAKGSVPFNQHQPQSQAQPHAQPQTTQPATEAAAKSAGKDSLFENPISFIKSLLPHARKAAAGKGMEPLMLVAQAALETGWGQKVIKKQDGSSSHNLFGIKADARWQGEKAKVQTLEYKDGVAKKENAFFRAYNSVEESVKDYMDFLASDSRYKEALNNVKEPAKYFNSLQSAGYATDPNYAKKVVNILNGKLIAGAKGNE